MANDITTWSEWDTGWWTRGGKRSGDCLASAEEALSLGLGSALGRDEQDLVRELAAIYASEINVRITCSGGRWAGEIGDEWNGWPEVTPSAVPLRVLVDWLPSAVCRAFPASEYAKRFTPRPSAARALA